MQLNAYLKKFYGKNADNPNKFDIYFVTSFITILWWHKFPTTRGNQGTDLLGFRNL